MLCLLVGRGAAYAVAPMLPECGEGIVVLGAADAVHDLTVDTVVERALLLTPLTVRFALLMFSLFTTFLLLFLVPVCHFSSIDEMLLCKHYKSVSKYHRNIFVYSNAI